MKMYEVGGCVRDEILGVPSKDIDFSVVLEERELNYLGVSSITNDPFEYMVMRLKEMGFKIYQETPEHLTIRGKFPRDHAEHPGLDADFVLARKDGQYTDGRRPDSVEPGSLYDDLARRDFTMNAIAKDMHSYLDPFHGMEDIKNRIVVAVGEPMERLTEDALRAVRAVRFAVTKGFVIEHNLARAMESPRVTDLVKNKISDERIRVELEKMFRYDTLGSLFQLHHYPHLTEAMFSGSVSLDATMKQKGRG